MSLDVYLIGPPQEVEETCYCCGHTEKKTREEEYFSSNITHNLSQMADEAGLYYPLWRPDELGIKRASELIEPLTTGLEILKKYPDQFKEFNAKNGWGTYEQFIPWVAEYLEACKQYPDAEVSVSR